MLKANWIQWDLKWIINKYSTQTWEDLDKTKQCLSDDPSLPLDHFNPNTSDRKLYLYQDSNGRPIFLEAAPSNLNTDVLRYNSPPLGRRRQWHPTPVLLPRKSHGWRSLVGCSPRGRWGSDTTEWLHFHFSLSCTGEGNGSPLVFFPGESQGRGSLVGCRLWGPTESDTTEVT